MNRKTLPIDERAHVRQDRDASKLDGEEGSSWKKHEGTYYLLPYLNGAISWVFEVGKAIGTDARNWNAIERNLLCRYSPRRKRQTPRSAWLSSSEGDEPDTPRHTPVNDMAPDYGRFDRTECARATTGHPRTLS